jgi:hypothetical protein
VDIAVNSIYDMAADVVMEEVLEGDPLTFQYKLENIRLPN